jgi:hypothetical protein
LAKIRWNTSHGFTGANPRAGRGEERAGEDPEAIYFTDQELLEWSVVTVGSNPEALKRESQTIEEIRGLIIKEIPVVSKRFEQKP